MDLDLNAGTAYVPMPSDTPDVTLLQHMLAVAAVSDLPQGLKDEAKAMSQRLSFLVNGIYNEWLVAMDRHGVQAHRV